jgi:hypothetical protein
MLPFLARAFAAEFLVAGTLVVAYATACRSLPRDPPPLRWAGVFVAGGFITTIGFHTLRLLGIFGLACALVTVAILVATTIEGTSLRRSLDRDRRFFGKLSFRWRRSELRLPTILLFVAALPIVLRPLLLPPIAWDTMTYHGVKAAKWVQHAGALDMDAPGPWALYRDLWSGAEVFTAWAMLPFRSDLLAAAPDAVEWLGLGVALVALARELGVREPHASAVAGLALVIPSLRILVGSAYGEIVQLMAAIAAMAIAVRQARDPSDGRLWLVAAGAGIAAGVKMTFVPMALVILLAACVTSLRRSVTKRAAITSIAVALIVFAASFAPWMVEAYRRHGLPFSPLPVKLLGVTLGEAPPELVWYEEISASAGSRLFEALAGDMQSPGFTILGFTAIAIYLLPALARRRPMAAVVIGTIMLADWAVFLSPHMSPVRQRFPGTSVRFLLPALVLGVVVAGLLPARHPRTARAFSYVVYASMAFYLVVWLPYGLTTTCATALFLSATVLLALAVSMRWIACSSLHVVGRALAGSVLVAAALGGLSVLRTVIRPDLLRGEFTNHDLTRYWVDAAIAADDPARPWRIAVTSGPSQRNDNWLVLPFIGRNLQNEAFYVPVSKSGDVGHFGGGSTNVDYDRSAEYESWWRRLLERRVDAVMSFSPASVELRWMESRPDRFRRISGEEGDWGLFAIVHGGDE